MGSRLDYSVLINGAWLDLRYTSDYDVPDHHMQHNVIDWVNSDSERLRLCNQLNGQEIYIRSSSVDAVRWL